MNKLLQRVVTAAVLICILLTVFFWLPPIVAIPVLGLFVVIAAWEWSAFVPFRARPARILYCAMLAGLMSLCIWLFPARLPLAGLLWVAMLWWGFAFTLVLRFPLPLGRAFGILAGIFVIVPAWAALFTLLAVPEIGTQYVLFVLLIIWAADIGAYFTGRALGRTRLAPEVSPGKTWEGVIGGLVAALCVALAGAEWFGWARAFVLPAALGVAFISVLGDLTVSMFKRNAGLKDSGNLFPGHGGVLDRIDSLTAAMPLFALQLSWAGLIPGASAVG